MVAGPTADDPSTPSDPVGDDFFAPGTGRDEAEFWSEADGAKPAKTPKTAKTAKPAKGPRSRTRRPTGTRPSGVKGRLAAAWAAESSARRALRGRPDATTAAARRRRRRIGAVVGGVALLAVALAVGESVVNDGTSTDRAGAEETTVQTGTDTRDAEDRAIADDTDDDYVESAIVDAPSSGRTKPASRPAASTTTTTAAAKAPTAAPQASGSSSGAGTPSPSGASGPAPTAPVPTTAAPAPTAPPPTPTTTAPRPAAPTVQSFTAKAASSPGGVCPPLQWATTFTWATTHASTVAITGLLEAPIDGLPGDGSRVVCRLLPTAPLGGWTLTASGAGGSATATAG